MSIQFNYFIYTKKENIYYLFLWSKTNDEERGKAKREEYNKIQILKTVRRRRLGGLDFGVSTLKVAELRRGRPPESRLKTDDSACVPSFWPMWKNFTIPISFILKTPPYVLDNFINCLQMIVCFNYQPLSLTSPPSLHFYDNIINYMHCSWYFPKFFI